MQPRLRLAMLFTLATLVACASQPARIAGNSAVATEAESCAARLGGVVSSGRIELDSSDIQILNWNIRKGLDPMWKADLQNIPDEADLMLFQEAALQTDDWSALAAGFHRSFAPGYRTRRALTGVMTVSNAEPLTQCKLVAREPWLGTPKATMITEYGLTGTDDTLLVVNIHAVNFTFGVRDFSEQIRQVQSIVKEHPGPVLFSGDFNTWRGRRVEIVEEAAESLGLMKLDFDEDHRKRAFGQPLDLVFVRGFQVMQATTRRVSSSDHNPISVRLRF